jgi:hypothetical protein
MWSGFSVAMTLRSRVSQARSVIVKSFFELLGKAMQTNGMTLRLCLLMLAAAAAYFIIQLR